MKTTYATRHTRGLFLATLSSCCFLIASPGMALTAWTTTEESTWLDSVADLEMALLDFNALTSPNQLLVDPITPASLIEDGFNYQIDSGPLDFGPLAVQANFAAIPPSVEKMSSTGIFTIDDTPYLFLRTEADGDRRTRLKFRPRVYGFAADVGTFGLNTAGESFVIEVTAKSGATATLPNDMLVRTFWGLVSDEPISHITFIGINPDGNTNFGRNFSLDNLRMALVPEPASGVLLMMALGCVLKRSGNCSYRYVLT